MDSQSSWPQSDILSKCFILVRWLHAHGASWSGTPPELSFHVATFCEGTTWFRSGDELVKFIQNNADMLRDLGVESTVQTDTGRTIVDLKIKDTGNVSPSMSPSDFGAQLAAMQANIESQQAASPVPEKEAAPEVPAASESIAVQLGNRLHDLTGVNSQEIWSLSSKVDQSSSQHTASPEPSAPGSFRSKSLIALVAVGLTLATLLFAFARTRTASTPAPAAAATPAPKEKTETATPTQAPAVAESVPTNQVTSPPAAAPPAATTDAPPENLDPAQRKNFEAVLAQATTSRLPAPQYDLGMRYAQGLGVPKDNAAAFTWLTLADSNGSVEADSALRTLAAQLSPEEQQRARVSVANSFIAGVVVQRNYVTAYRSLLQAERSGSAEAATLRKELEVRMPVWQILQAGGKPPARDADK